MTTRRWNLRIGLPLLARELLEQAARRRTYILRVFYACLLFASSLLLFNQSLRIGAASPLAVLGHGRAMFEMIMGLQFAGIFLFMPAITCGVITHEKERNSLMLLFLTRLGSWTIVFEKLLSRVVPMFCYLLLSLPLLAFAYSLGGISAEYLWSGVWMLAVTTLQVGSLAVACSSYFRTTVASFVASYFLGMLLLFGPGFAMRLLFQTLFFGNLPIIRDMLTFGPYSNFEQVLLIFFSPAQFFDASLDAPKAILRSLPILLSGGACLVVSRQFLVRRAFVAPRQVILNLFQRIDRLFTRLNDNRITRGRILIRDKSTLPETEPVAWRETTKRSLGRARYLFRVFVAVEGPVAAVYIFNLTAIGSHVRMDSGAGLLYLLWGVAVLIIAVQAASLIAGERTRQTLDVLATTPLTGREIILQKYRSVRRVMIVLLVPFCTIYLFQGWWRTLFDSKASVPLYLICSALTVGIYLPLVAWLSLLIGLFVRTQARAITGSVAAIVGWCVLPLVFIIMPLQAIFGGIPRAGLAFIGPVSPMMFILASESNGLLDAGRLAGLAVAMNFVWYGTMLALIRRYCLSNADRFLGRVDCE